MGTRAEDKRLTELREAGHTIYSISRLDCMNNCLYEAYKTYVLHEKGKDNIYAALGGRIHDTLEAIVNNEATEADLLPAMNDELEDMELLDLQFPKDRGGGDSIKDNWIKDMTHFANTYRSPRNKQLTTEDLIIYKTNDGHYLQGFIDLYWTRKNGEIDIYDYKTSTLYSGKDIANHARQLILYALAKEQEGFKVRNASWIFLKYLDVTFQGYKTAKSKTKTTITKHIERRKLFAELEKYFRQDLLESGIDEFDVQIILDKTKEKLYTTTELPKELKDKYIIKPCVISVDLTDEAKQETVDYIQKTIKFWESLDKEDEKNFPPKAFTKLKSTTGEETLDMFYDTQLCPFFEKCKYAKDFLDQWDSNNNTDDDLF